MRPTFALLTRTQKYADAVPEKFGEYVRLVGKNSRFLTNLRSAYVAEGVAAKKQQHRKSEFEKRYNAVRADLLSPQARNAENGEFNEQIVALLRRLTPADVRSPAAVAASQAAYRRLTSFKTVAHRDVPPFPSVLTTETFAAYVDRLVAHKYTCRGASGQSTGVVVPLLKNLFRADNMLVKPLRSVHSYNAAILFFLKLHDLDFAKTLLRQMPDDFVVPDRSTYNAFLLHVAYPKTAFAYSPLGTAVHLLAEMKQRGLQADLATWWLVFKITRQDAIFRQELKRIYFEDYGFPKTSEMAAILMELEFESLSAAELVQLSQSHSRPSNDSVHLVLQKYLDENRLDDSWTYLKSQTRRGFRPNTATLQVYLESFVNDVHLSVGAFYTFLHEFGLRPSGSNFYSVIQATTKTGFHDNWRAMARIVYAEMKRLQGSDRNKAGYWITRLKARALTDRKNARAKLDLDSPLDEHEKALLARIKGALVWGDKSTVPTGPAGREFAKVSREIGFRPVKARAQTATPEDVAVKEKYKKGVRRRNLGQNYFQRAKIVDKGPMRHLMDELVSRKVIPKRESLQELGITSGEATHNPMVVEKPIM